MKKIIIPFTGDQFSNGSFEFARRLNEYSPILLAGVFLPETFYPGDYEFTGPGVMELPPLVQVPGTTFEQETAECMLLFKKLCVAHNIEHTVHSALSEFAQPQLIKETRFADLVILGSETFYYDEFDNRREMSTYLPAFLRKTECPVLVVPESYTFPEDIVLAYNGGKSSAFAIKQFTYLLPELTGQNTLLVFASADSSELMPDMQSIEELAARHFADLTILKMEADASRYFETMMLDKKAPILVTGAYERSQFSSFFKKNFAAELINDFQFPIFIAHC